MQAIPAISNLKIRASYGLTGNQNIADFAARGLWSGAAAYAALAGTTPSQLANPELKWETTKQIDIGIDIGLFNERLTFTADYYQKKRRTSYCRFLLQGQRDLKAYIKTLDSWKIKAGNWR